METFVIVVVAVVALGAAFAGGYRVGLGKGIELQKMLTKILPKEEKVTPKPKKVVVKEAPNPATKKAAKKTTKKAAKKTTKKA